MLDEVNRRAAWEIETGRRPGWPTRADRKKGCGWSSAGALYW